jgi:hypothetical protein
MWRVQIVNLFNYATSSRWRTPETQGTGTCLFTARVTTVSGPDLTALNDRIINEQWIGKYLERSGLRLIQLLSRNFPKGVQGNHEKSVSQQSRCHSRDSNPAQFRTQLHRLLRSESLHDDVSVQHTNVRMRWIGLERKRSLLNRGTNPAFARERLRKTTNSRCHAHDANTTYSERIQATNFTGGANVLRGNCEPRTSGYITLYSIVII